MNEITQKLLENYEFQSFKEKLDTPTFAVLKVKVPHQKKKKFSKILVYIIGCTVKIPGFLEVQVKGCQNRTVWARVRNQENLAKERN